MCTPGLKGLIFFMYCREQKQKQTLRTKTNLKKKDAGDPNIVWHRKRQKRKKIEKWQRKTKNK